MTCNPARHHRRSIRLKGYDYSRAGMYFITICTKNRACLFGNIENGVMQLNDAGRMVENQWLKLPDRFQNIALYEYVVMPNHFHAILEIVGATLVVVQNHHHGAQNHHHGVQNHHHGVQNDHHGVQNDRNGQPQGIAPTGKTIGNIVGAIKSITTVEYIRAVKNMEWIPFNGKLWQRNYYERIIRDEKSYLDISDYIIKNPANWDKDSLK